MGITDLSTPALKINRLSGVLTGHSIPLLSRLFTGKRPQGLRLGRRVFHCGLPRILKVHRKMIVLQCTFIVFIQLSASLIHFSMTARIVIWKERSRP